METYKLTVPGISCASCVNTIKNTLAPLSGIELVSADLIEKTINLKLADEQDLQRAFAKLEYVGFNCTSVDEDKPARIAQAQPFWLLTLKAILASGAGITLLILSIVGISMSPLIMIGVGVGSFLLLLFAGFHIYRDAIVHLFKGKTVTMDALFTLSTLLVFTISMVSLFFPALGLPVIFHAALMIIGFRNLGKAIEFKAKQTILRNLSMQEQLPESVETRSETNEEYELKNINHIEVGNIIKLRRGKTIPLDGTIIDGSAIVQDTIVSGDVIPRLKSPGDEVMSGMVVKSGELTIEVTSSKNW